MFKLKKNKKFTYKRGDSEKNKESSIYFKRRAKKSKSRLTLYIIMLILIFSLLFYFTKY